MEVGAGSGIKTSWRLIPTLGNALVLPVSATKPCSEQGLIIQPQFSSRPTVGWLEQDMGTTHVDLTTRVPICVRGDVVFSPNLGVSIRVPSLSACKCSRDILEHGNSQAKVVYLGSKV